MWPIAAVFRSYAKTEEQVDEVVARALESAKVAAELKVDGREVFCRVIILVPTDYDYRGETAKKLVAAFQNVKSRAEVMVASGHHSSEALNHVMRVLNDANVDHALIISNKALSYLKADIMKKASALLDFNLVVGVRIKELDDVHEMPIENTFAIWNVEHLLAVGGFTSKSGVEEIAPLSSMVERFRFCATIITSSGGGKLDIRKSADGAARHEEVKQTKRERQQLEAERCGVSLEFLNENIREVLQ